MGRDSWASKILKCDPTTYAVVSTNNEIDGISAPLPTISSKTSLDEDLRSTPKTVKYFKIYQKEIPAKDGEDGSFVPKKA